MFEDRKRAVASVSAVCRLATPPKFHSPSAAEITAEITADMQTAHDLGGLAVSFFAWQTATQDEWSALGAFTWK